MKKLFFLGALTVLCFAIASQAQAPSARVEGRITLKGAPAAGLQIALTNGTNGRSYKSKTDGHGAFDLVGVAAGANYTVEVFSPAGESLFKRTGVAVTAQDSPLSWNIDLSDPAHTNLGGTAPATSSAPKYTREQLETLKVEREKAQNMNTLITQAMNAMNARDFQSAIAPLQQLIQMDPGRYEYFQSLGEAQLNLGRYDEAIVSFDKGIRLASKTSPDPKNPATDSANIKGRTAAMLTNEGNAYLKLHKNHEAIAAYTQAAELDPNPATAYFNLCATQYNAANPEGALQACNKVIALDPNKADAYFIKGSLLVADSKTDATGRLIAPPGTAEALNKYLELQPDGPHANDVKQMLDAIGAKIETTYTQKKKK
jgi:tetratricopeptide (TPR) repeat protein